MWRNQHLSISRLRVYLQCARKFYFRYVEPVPKDEQIQDDEGPATFGITIHEVLETLYAEFVQRKHQGPFPVDSLVPNWQAAFTRSDLKSPEMYREGLRILRSYAQRHPFIDYTTILGVEQEITLQVEEFKITGYMDRVERVSEDEAKVIDYKTNRRPFSDEDLEDDIQMSLYGFATKQMFPWAKRITFAFEMVRLGFVQTATRTAAQLEDVPSYLVSIGKKTELDEEWKPTLGQNCMYCEYRNRCPGYQKALAKRHPKVAEKTDLDAVAKEYTAVSAYANAAYARKKELDAILRAEIAFSFEDPRLDGKIWDLWVQPQSEYNLVAVIKMMNEAKVPKEHIWRLVELASASKEKVEEFLKSLEPELDRSKYLLLKKEVEVLGLRPLAPKIMLKSKAL